MDNKVPSTPGKRRPRVSRSGLTSKPLHVPQRVALTPAAAATLAADVRQAHAIAVADGLDWDPNGEYPASVRSQFRRTALYCMHRTHRTRWITTMASTTVPTTRPRPKVMTLTDAAAARVQAIMGSKPGVVGLRIGVKKGGCAGMEYTMTWAETQDRFDEVVEDKGAKVLIDPKALLYLLGTEMDYKTEKLKSEFVFNNPNQKSACGCGESVNLTPASKDKLEPV